MRRTRSGMPGHGRAIPPSAPHDLDVHYPGSATGAVVLGMGTSNVDSVFVAGRALKWRGQVVGVDVASSA